MARLLLSSLPTLVLALALALLLLFYRHVCYTPLQQMDFRLSTIFFFTEPFFRSGCLLFFAALLFFLGHNGNGFDRLWICGENREKKVPEKSRKTNRRQTNERDTGAITMRRQNGACRFTLYYALRAAAAIEVVFVQISLFRTKKKINKFLLSVNREL